MSLTQTINYVTAGNFVFDAALIEFPGSLARLKKQDDPGQTFSQAFTADTGFTYDSAKAEFAGGLLRQLAQRPANATFGARFDSFVDGNWGDGVITATVNNAAITAGKLDLTGASDKGLTFPASGNMPADPLVGCVRFRFTPNYNGSPAAGQIFLNIKSNGGGQNEIELFHATNGSFFVLMNDENGTNILSNSIGAFVAVAGTELEIEMSWDLAVAKKVKFFGEGFLVADLDADFVRSTDIDVIAIGGESGTDFYYRDLVIFDAVQHVANYTAHTYTLPAGDFVESLATLPAFTYSGPGTIQALTAFAATVAGAPRFIVDGKYWNGSAWASSNGSYAQANTAAVVNAHIGTLTAVSPLIAKVAFGDGNTRGSVDALTVTYTGEVYPTSDPAVVNASGIGADDLLGFAATLAAAGADEVRFQLVLSGTNYWWTGAAWAASNGTLAQANTAAEIEANKAAIDIDDGLTLKLRVLLHSDDGSTTPSITQAVIDYDFFAPVPTLPDECTVYGFVRDILGDVEATAAVLVVTLRQQFTYADEFLVMPSVKEFTADDDGRFEASLIETETAGKTYKFQVRYVTEAGVTKTLKLGNAEVPNAPSVNLAALTFT